MADGRITIDTKIDQKGAEKGTKELKGKLEGVSKKAGSIGKTMSTSLTLPILAFGAAGIKASQDFSAGQRTIQNGLGTTQEETEKLIDIANSVYKDGFGESLEATSQALVDIKQQFGDLVDEADLEQVTKDALALSKTMDADVNEIARAGTTLMKEFGDSSTEAFDLMAWGAQNGLDFSDEMLDNIAEYGPLFSEMGYSSEEYFNLLKQGTEEGAYNLDYINDVMKEFQVRIKDGSEKTGDAMKQMSKSTQDLWDDMKNGKATVKEVSDAVMKDLGKMDDTTANMVGVELFGTKWEDLESDAVLALGNVDKEIDNLDGTMGDITKAQEESFGQQFQSLLRESMDALRPVGEILLELAEDALPPLIEGITRLAKWFNNLSPTMQIVVIGIAGLLAVLGPLLIMISMLVPLITAISATMLMWVGIIVAAIAIVGILAYLIYKYWDEIKAFTIEIWNAVKEFFVQLWEDIKLLFTTFIEWAKQFIKDGWKRLKKYTTITWNAIKAFFSAIWGGIKAIFFGVVNGIINLVITRWNEMKSATTTIFNAIKSFITTTWNNIKSFFKRTINIIVDYLKGRWEALEDFTTRVFNTIKDTIIGVWEGVSSATTRIWEGIVDTIKGAVNGVIAAINGMLNAIGDIHISIPKVSIPGTDISMGGGSIGFPDIPNIPYLDVGTNFVAQDGLAMLHAGEAVVPKEYNPALGNGGGGDIKIEKFIANHEYDYELISRGLEQLKKRRSRARGQVR